jgi:hypothetical protein
MRKTIAALACGILLGTAAMQISAAIPTGGGSSGPVEPTAPGILGRVNDYLGNLVSASANTGELQFFATQTWTANSNVATTMTSLGPQGSHTTIQKWFVVVDNTGVVRYIPAY